MSCTVKIARPLRSYTCGASSVVADGETLSEVLADLGVEEAESARLKEAGVIGG